MANEFQCVKVGQEVHPQFLTIYHPFHTTIIPFICIYNNNYIYAGYWKLLKKRKKIKENTFFHILFYYKKI